MSSNNFVCSFSSSVSYRRKIIIDNTKNQNDLTDYQILVTLDTACLISAGKMRSDCGDIRFIDTDGKTLLNYWIEGPINSTNTRIWVKVPNIPANSTKTIYLYYGNPNATSLSNPYNTFDIFDDFEGDVSSRWTAVTGAVRTVSDINGQSLRLLGQFGDKVISNKKITSPWQFYLIELKVKYASFGIYGPRLIAALINSTHPIDPLAIHLPNHKVAIVIEIGGGTNTNRLSGYGFQHAYNNITWSIGTTYNMVFYVLPDRLYWSRDGGATTFLSITGTSLDVTGERFIILTTWDSGNDVRIDDLRVRKYTYPEPTVILGSEEKVYFDYPI